MAYLDDHPPRVRQFRARGTTPSGVIVVHTAESVPDTVAIDGGAEGVANFIRNRSDFGSYHWLADSDSLIDLVRMTQQAYGDGTGSNSHAIHISAATQAHRWKGLSRDWTEATVRNMARAAAKADAYVFSVHKVHIPAKRITRAQSDQRVEGFISHAARDPERRSDPGDDFPWDFFLETYEKLVFGKPEEKPELTRGDEVDRVLRQVSAAIHTLDNARGKGKRGNQLEAAERHLRAGRRDLRDIAFLNQK
jgi:hypothetical protein